MTRVRDSGMAKEAAWEAFFRPAEILVSLGLEPDVGDVVEFGCGYGTFTIPAARVVGGTVWTLDIEPEMVERTLERARGAGLTNVEGAVRDFAVDGTGRPDGEAGYVMLFNILHHERPLSLLAEARRLLRPGGIVGVVHWIHDANTPRGPDLSIRPRPEQAVKWVNETGFEPIGETVSLAPYHWGFAARRDLV